MTRLLQLTALVALIAVGAPSLQAAEGLSVVQSGPREEISARAEANEVRVVFSEAMVALGRIPDPVEAPFFRIEPRVPGRFRWSGTDTLIFTPEAPLPFATRFMVTVETTAASRAGRRLGAPHRFSFTTPTVRLLSVGHYRRGARYDAPVVLALRFNQPVSHASLGPQLDFRHAPRAWTPPALPAEGLARMAELDPASQADYEAKVALTRAAAASSAPVAVAAADAWDEKRFAPGPDLLVFETVGVPPTDSWIRLTVGPGARGLAGPETPGKEQHYVVELEPTLFVTGLRCSTACSPESYNPLRLRARLAVGAVHDALAVRELSDPPRRLAAAPLSEEAREDPTGHDYWSDDWERSSSLTLQEAGYSLLPGRSYELSLGRELTAFDGQKLGYTWVGRLENWHRGAFTSFGEGHGVWESSGGEALPFYARNLQSVTQWAAPLAKDELVPALKQLEARSFRLAPPGEGLFRKLKPVADELQSYGLDLGPVLSQGKGLVWAALRDGETIERAHRSGSDEPRATVVQVTNLSLSVKDSPSNTLVLVTRLDDGRPVEGARVAIRDLENREVWSGTTDAEGLALAEGVDLRNHDSYWQLRFVVTAEKDGDLAYLGNDWTEGIEPWYFGTNYDLDESRPLLRGSVFTDRGVYKLGEELHFKALLRSDTVEGIRLLPAGTEVELTLKDNEGQELEKRKLALSEWGSADGAFRLPSEGALGRYTIAASVGGQRLEIYGGFLVAAYRRPDFRVDAELGGESAVAGTHLAGAVAARYLFGAAMGERPVRFSLTRIPDGSVPAAVTERFPRERYAFLDEAGRRPANPSPETLRSDQGQLDAEGRFGLDFETDAASGRPYVYSFEGEVEDVSRQRIAGRASFRVDPAPWYLALGRPPYFAELESGFETEVAAVGLDGRPVAGVEVEVTLTQVQWHSVRRAEGHGFYAWETERREVPAGKWSLTTTEQPAPLHVGLERGGYYYLEASARDAAGRSTSSTTGLYVLGAGYTAWARYDHNRIDLVPERTTYAPGETARILIKSPWDEATALLTTEREGVRTRRVFTLGSTQETVEVPIAEDDIPNLYVSVLLVKGRSQAFAPADGSDPGKPAFRLGYAELEVEDRRKRLAVAVESDREEYRPGSKARVSVAVVDHTGRPAPSEVTLWAVDYGVLSLTAYRTPDVLPSVWVAKALQVMTEDSRQRVVSRRAIVPKGGDEGGGGGFEDGPGSPVRKDFRVLAFWLGSLATDAEGRVFAEVSLPEDLTTYRIMAVAADKESRFGRGEREIRINKPLLLKPAFPRFLALGDRALFGAVVHSQLPEGGKAVVRMRSLDPERLSIESAPQQELELGPEGSAELRFEVRALGVGRARLQLSVELAGESDAFEDSLPVELLVSPEVVAAYGQALPAAEEAVELPRGVVTSYGGLELELASTALVGLGEGARYLVDYPYGCAEQRASAALALVLTAHLGDAFRVPGLDPAALEKTARETLDELPDFQCGDGGFAYWKGGCPWTSPYLTSYVLHVLGRARSLGHPVKQEVLAEGYDYLEQALTSDGPPSDGRWPAYTAWRAFAVKVLAEAGRNVDSHATRLYQHLDRMPVFAIAYLHDALAARRETGERRIELLRRIRNAILPEGGRAHVEELSDPYLLWFWNSNVRSTALALGSLVRSDAELDFTARLVRWLMQARKRGRWGNTQENAVAMEALIEYYQKYEAEPPDFAAVVKLGLETLARAEFHGRSAVPRAQSLPMAELLAKGGPGARLGLGFEREGKGTLFYAARLRYAADAPLQEGLDMGFGIERSYALAQDGAAPALSFAAGDLVRVTLTLALTKERRFVAVTDPLPAGFEPVEAWFATTATDLAREQRASEQAGGDWTRFWQRGGFDHVERHDDRVLLFATRLAEGEHVFSYLARATTAGSFRTAPARVEEMYAPEVFGRTATDVIEVRR